MNRKQILMLYYKHLLANASMYNVAIGSWETYENDDVSQIENSLRRVYNEIDSMQGKASKLISMLMNQEYKMSSLKSLEQWYRENQLSDLLDKN